METILKIILCICVIATLIVVMFDLYEISQKSLNIIFLIGLLNLYSKRDDSDE